MVAEALLEVDVTAASEFIQEHKARTGEALSFTGYPASCLGRAVDEDKSVQTYPKGRKHLVIARSRRSPFSRAAECPRRSGS